MRYEDASISSQGAGATDARDDADALSAGSRGPATGNTITGEGTITGAAGADVVADGPGKIVALEGASGSDSDGGSMRVEGRFGELTMDSLGSYSYTPHAAKPEGGSDVFRYTLADAAGARDTATLTIDIGREIEKIEANAQQIVVGPDGVVTLPPGVQLSDILVVGRNLVINLPDGTQMVIVDGAVFVPQLVLDGVEVPATNLAALLIDAEPKPASGTPLSSGGNFAVDVPPLDPGVPLGDLIPPTDLAFTPPTFEDAGQFVDDEPEILIQPDGQPAAVAAVDSVNEAGLPTRNSGEPAGSGESADGNSADNDDPSEATTGTILIDAKDDPAVVTVNATAVTGVGQVIAGAYGNLTITSISDTAIGYSYTLRDNTSGNATHDDFSVTVTDRDGDQATATLTVDIVDDVPTARPDTDSIAAGTFGPATGNVITDAAPGDAGDGDSGADTVGADNATVTSISGAGGSDSTFSGGVLVVNGQYGVLTIDAAGNYSYARNAGTPGGVTDTFNYTITDGDGDPSSSTLTISIADATPRTGTNPTVLLDDDALAGGNSGGIGDDPDAANISGTLAGSGGDGALTFDLQTSGAPAGFTYVDGPNGSILVQQGGVTVLTITLNAATGAYTVTQNAAIDHAALGDENNVSFTINYTVTDVDGDPASGTLTVNVDDDTPTIVRTDVSAPTLTVDETDLSTTATGNFATLFTVSHGADGAGSTVYAVSVVSGTDSGLDDVATGQDILLFNNNGVVEGRVGSATGAVAFTVGVNATTGVVTLDQVRAIEHPDATNSDDPVSPTATSIQLTVTVTDGDGDPASQTINIGGNLVFEDDGPSAANDSDSIAAGGYGPATGNVITDAAAGDAGDGDAGADSPGADGLGGVTAIASVNVPANSDVTADGSGNYVVSGQYGVLTINADGSYSYTRNAGTPGGVNDVFTYTLADRDGDTATATLTIAIGDSGVSLDAPDTGEAGTLVDEAGLPVRGGEPAGTGEAADGNGADNDDASETTSGTINFTPGDGPAVVTIDGVAVTGVVGQTFAGAHGTLTITSYNAGGSIGYSYTLADNTSGNATFDDFAIVVTDQDGDTASDTLVVDIVDDEPIAVNDSDSIPAGGFGPATGNVITDAEGDGGKDNVGADNATITRIASNNFPANVDTTATGGNYVVNGQYGVLTINTDGSYSYTRNAGTPGGVSDVFTYTLTDGDNDSTTATLTIAIDDAFPSTGVNPAVGLDDDALGGNAGGTGDDPNSVNTTGTLAGSGGDGALTFAVQTTGAPAGFTYVSGGAGIVLVQQGGTTVLTVTVNANGTYSVVQNAAIDHSAGGDENNQPFTINYTVTDIDGDPAPGTLSISVDDDTPVAVIDTDSIAAGSFGPATGNVITDLAAGDAGDGDAGADSVGADTPGSITAISGFGGSDTSFDGSGNLQVNGQYGVLTIKADGSYSYTRNAGTPGGVNDVFTYTLTDGDGDSTTATLTISIADAFPSTGVNPAVGLDDDALGGNAGGTDDDPNAVNTTGTLAGSGGDGALTYAVQTTGAPAGFTYVSGGAGIVLVQQGGTTVLTVTVNANGTYSVVQNAAIDHSAGGDENNQPFTINYTVTDIDGDPAPGTLSISVDDDTPVAVIDSDTVGAPGSTATGNVITDAAAGDSGDSDTGADSVGADTPGTITLIASNNVPANSDNTFSSGVLQVNGQYGVLTIEADGDYSYTRNSGTPGGVNDVFTYTLTDGDGDSTTATLTIALGDATPTAGSVTVLLDDDALAGGNPGTLAVGDDVDSQNTSGTLPGSGGDGTLTFAFDTSTAPAGFTYDTSTPGTLLIKQGSTTVVTVTLAANGTYSVVQNAPILHAAGSQENNQLFTIGYKVTDADLDTASGTITINVDDDTPTIDVTKSSDSGVILTTQDADTIGTATDTDASTANFSGVFGLAFSAGADGTNTTPTLSYTLGVSTPGVDSGLDQGGANIYLYLIGGKVVGSTSATQTGVNSGNTVFDVSVSTGGVVTLTQYSQIDHPLATDPSPTGTPFADHLVSMADNLVTLTASSTITDKDGDPLSDSETVSIGANLSFADHGPTAANDSATQPTENVAFTIDALFNDSFGADGVDTTNATKVFVSTQATQGTVTYDTSTGLFTYTPNSGAGSPSTSDSFQYTIVDKDGDTSVATVTITLQPDSTPQVVNVIAKVDDDGLLGSPQGVLESGNGDIDANAGEPGATASEAVYTGQVTVNFGGDTGTVSFSNLHNTFATVGTEYVKYSWSGTTLTAVVHTTASDGVTAQARAGTTLFTVSLSPSGAYTVTLLDNVLHASGGNNENSAPVVDLFYRAADSDGDLNTTGKLSITFNDDMPSINSVTTPLQIDNDSDPVGTGNFAFAIGADTNSDFDDITVSNFAVSVNGVSLATEDFTFTEGVEDGTFARYSFTFTYDTGSGGTQTATGTLVFNKSTGQYTVDLEGPIEGFSVLQTSTPGNQFQGYIPGTSTPDNTQPEVSVTSIVQQIGEDPILFVQFTGDKDPSGGGIAHSAGGDSTFVEGELITNDPSWVSTSGSSNGVAGDTIGGDEILDFNLYTSNPEGHLGLEPTGQATSMFLKFDGIGTAEDFIVILKLYDPVNDVYTTKAVMVTNSDIFKGPGTGPGDYDGITLDNNDGLVIIEPNDYNETGETWVIVGAQIITDPANVDGTAINLNSAVGVGGDSDVDNDGFLDTQTFAADVDGNAPLKISSIGFVTGGIEDQNATLSFDVTVEDADGDSVTQSITVNIGDTTTAPASTAMVSQESIEDSSSFSLTSSDSVDQQRTMSAANNNSVLLGAIAAAGLGIGTAAAAQDVTPPGLEVAVEMMSTGDGGAVAVSTLVEQNNSVGNGFAGETREALDTAPGGSPTGHSASAGTQSLTAGEESGAAAPAELDAGTESEQSDPGQSGLTSAGVAMPSAAMLAEANAGDNGLDGQAQGTGEVGRVLADALAGGGGPDIDAVLDAVTNQAPGGPAALEALATHAPGGVSGWHTAGFAGFPGGHGAATVEPMLHHDAVQAA